MDGKDTITDFQLGAETTNFVAADMLSANATLAGMAGDPATLGLDDLDANSAFTFSATDDGDLLITRQTGSVEVNGVAFDATTDSLVEIAQILEIEVA